MGVIDALIILAFILYAVASGFRSKDKASENLEEYFLAGRSLPGWKSGLSMAATQFSADTPLLVTGLIATAGIFSLWRLWIYALAFLLMGFVLAPSWRRVGVITDAELTEIRYGAKPAAALRGVKAIYFGTIFNCTVLAMVLFAAGAVAEPFLVWNQWLPEGLYSVVHSAITWVGVPLSTPTTDEALMWINTTNNIISIMVIVAVTTLYSTTGGLRSVVDTDVMQFGLMMLGTTLYAFWVVSEAGGMGAIIDGVREHYDGGGPGGITADQVLAFTPSMAKDASLALLAVFALQWLVQMNADGTGYLAQRSMACKSDKDARMAALVFTVAQVLVRSLLWLPIGLGLLVLFPADASMPLETLRLDRESTFVRGVSELLPPGLLGLMLTAMLAALASTVDTHLNWGASYWTNDIYKRFVCRHLLKREPSARSLVWVARLSNLFILLLGLLIMTQLSSIQTAWRISLLLGAGMGVPLVLRWLWWRITAWGEIAAIGASSVLAPVLLFTVEGDATRLLLMALLATGACLAASFLLGPEKQETLREFYQRAKPPGFWSVVASDPTADRARLLAGLRTMVVCAFSLFSLLTGLGSWIASSPAPSWWPVGSGAWIFCTLLVGAGLVPVWWRWGMGNEPQRPEAKASESVVEEAAVLEET